MSIHHSFHLVCLALLALTGCTHQYNIDGNSSIAGIDGQKMYLIMTQSDGKTTTIPLDSCEVVHGCFNFGGAVDSVAMVDLYMGNDPMMPLVLENGPIFIQMDNAMQQVTGGPLNARLNNFLMQYGRLENQLWDLNRKARLMLYEGKTLDQIVASVDPIKEKLISQMRTMEIQFVRDNYDNVLGPGYFMRMCNNIQMYSPTFGMENDNDILNLLIDAPDNFLQHPVVVNYLYLTGTKPEQLEAMRAERKTVRTKGKKLPRRHNVK